MAGKLNIKATNCAFHSIDPRHASTLYAAGYEYSSPHPSQVWKSIDGGANWIRFTD
jgi:hypothetical protein